MPSKTQIAKLALQHIGDRFDIADLDEETVEAEQIALVYDEARRAVLRRHPWNFATKFASPATLNITPPGGWDYAYAYPSDAVRIIEIINPLGRNLPRLEFERANLSDNTRVILTDQEDAEFRYTADIDDPNMYDPEFVMAFSFLLASFVAMALTGDLQIKKDLENEADRQIAMAGSTDANEGRTEEAPEASWITARR
jgi:hypothetical protein